MAFDSTWEEIHSEMEWGKYPPEELVRFIMRKYKGLSRSERKEIKVLELGCGQGANMLFLSREGFDVYGIDGSRSAIDKCKKRFDEEGLEGNFMVGDFSRMNLNLEFDVIIDIVSLYCCARKDIERTINNVRKMLKEGANFLQITFQTGSYGYNTGIEIEKNTFKDISHGPLKGRGQATFLSLEDVKNLYSDFKNVDIEYRIISENNMKNEVKYWIISCSK